MIRPAPLILYTAIVTLSMLSSSPLAYPQAKAPVDEPGVRKNPTKAFPGKEFRELAASSVVGELDPKQLDTLDLAAQHFVYRVTFQELQTKPGSMAGLVDDLAKTIDGFAIDAKTKGAKNEKVRDKFLELTIAKIKDVLPNPRPIARVNGAQMLVLVAKSGFEEVADPLLDIVQDNKQNDGVKYWAYAGLKELFEHANKPDAAPLKNRERTALCVLALENAIGRNGPTKGPREEIEGFRLFRREAVRALAQSRIPVVADKDGKNIKSYPALALLRIVAQPEKLIPEARFDERVEAAIGLGKMQSKLSADYQPDVAAYHMGQLVVQLGERSQEPTAKDMEPWRIHAARLLEAFDQMKADSAKNSKDKDAAKYVAEVAGRATTVLAAMEANKTPVTREFKLWLSQYPPKTLTLFRGVPESEMKSVEKPDPEKPEKPEKKG